MKKSLNINGGVIEYNLKIAQQKNIILNVKSGKVNISAPPGVDCGDIEKLIQRNINKINNVIHRYNINRKISLNSKDPYIIIFNKKYPIKFYKKEIDIKLTNQMLHITQGSDVDFMIKKIYNYLKQYYKNLFQDYLNKWSKKMNLEYDELVVKNMVSRWGICYPFEYKIILNIRLIHFDVRILEYVIIHELAHLLHTNHSKEFWMYVAKFCHYYKDVKKVLKNPGV
ncbi:SprT family zinc-dependent metalloprotease [Spiroplasma endosymbiont of Amphibalanus improvisus]|uniref:M48 family metallopeptidase n=1 Tax=Spiroplasma endosymbiont of Amphibalanus improvisus TaxID=3066327 RepID=UPI00313EB08A